MAKAYERHDETHHMTNEQLSNWTQTAIDMWNPVSAMLQLWNPPAASRFIAVGLEWNRFVARRLKQDVELPLRLAASKSPDEYWSTCSDFVQHMISDYQDEVGKLSRAAIDSAQAADDVRKSMDARLRH